MTLNTSWFESLERLKRLKEMYSFLRDTYPAFDEDLFFRNEVKLAIGREENFIKENYVGWTAEKNMPEHDKVKNLLGKNYVGPEVLKATLGVREVGTVPPLPRDIMQILNEDCKFNPRGKIKDTHLLVFVPGAVDGEDFTVNKLKSMAMQVPDQQPVFYSQEEKKWYADEPFANTGNPSGEWVLMPKYFVPETLGVDYPTQSEVLRRNHPEYRTARALGLITGLVLNKLNGGDNGDFATCWGWCEDTIKNPAGARVGAGDFAASGLRVGRGEGSYRRDFLGGAAFRNW